MCIPKKGRQSHLTAQTVDKPSIFFCDIDFQAITKKGFAGFPVKPFYV
jgi:hypothetical protein